MSDQDLPVSGRDAQIIVTVDGVPIAIVDVIVSHSAEPILTEVTQKHLGKTGSDIDVDFEGWKGDLEISRTTVATDDVIDGYIAAKKARTGTVLNLSETTYYRDGSSRAYTYPDITLLSAARSAKRGEASTSRWSWKTGQDRIAA